MCSQCSAGCVEFNKLGLTFFIFICFIMFFTILLLSRFLAAPSWTQPLAQYNTLPLQINSNMDNDSNLWILRGHDYRMQQ